MTKQTARTQIEALKLESLDELIAFVDRLYPQETEDEIYIGELLNILSILSVLKKGK